MRSFRASGANPLSPQNSSGADQLCRRMLRHAGAPDCLCGGSGAACHRRHPSLGPVAARRASDPSRQIGLERGRPLATRPLPSASSIYLEKQRLTRSSGIPKAAARMSSAGPRRAKSRSPNSKSTARRRIEPVGPADRRHRRPDGPRRHARTGGGRRHRQQIRRRDAASASAGRAGDAPALPRLHQAPRRSPILQISGWSCQGDTCRPGAPRSAAC